MKLGYVILYVPSVVDAVEFYEKAFGASRRFVHESGRFAELSTGETALAFCDEALAATVPYEEVRRERKAPGIEVAFVTDAVQAAFQRAVEAGAIALLPPIEKPWGQTVSYVRDLNGFLVEICSPVAA